MTRWRGFLLKVLESSSDDSYSTSGPLFMQVCGLVTFDLLRWERIVCLLEPYILSILRMWMTPYCDICCTASCLGESSCILGKNLSLLLWHPVYCLGESISESGWVFTVVCGLQHPVYCLGGSSCGNDSLLWHHILSIVWEKVAVILVFVTTSCLGKKQVI